MPESKTKKRLPRTKSYASILNMFETNCYDNLSSIERYNKHKQGQLLLHTKHEDSQYTHTEWPNYVTSENYNTVCKFSNGTMIPSTSTIFYDLDDIAKRHSFHCLTEISKSNKNVLKENNFTPCSNAFGAKAKAIVQECATQIHPILKPRDSIHVNSKKLNKQYSTEPVRSSEIFLRDNDYMFNSDKYNLNFKDTKRPQNIWSYAKYRTELTKPPEEKRARSKNKGKRISDPCPCQLFSYACPCTDKKSLTGLANSKFLTVADVVTSTTIVSNEKKRRKGRNKKHKYQAIREDKITNTSVAQMVVIVPKIDSGLQDGTKELTDTKNNQNKTKQSESRKWSRRILCPNCKEKVEVINSVSTTEGEESSIKCEHSSVHHNSKIPSPTAYAFRSSPNRQRSKTMDETPELCLHEPRCELLPVCQMSPESVTNKCVKKPSRQKSTSPRIIRITKACRHHPPCTVVPSCQRANVLKNNCEYIPPCLHRPRCVNLPLCVPFSKSMHYKERSSMLTDDCETCDCLHIPTSKYIPVCQPDSISNTIEHQINMINRVENACEYVNGYNTPNIANLTSPNSNRIPNLYFPCQLSSSPCNTQPSLARSNKSCQFNVANVKKIFENKDSHETIIFIRDVGCQFRNKSLSPKKSIRSRVSSNSFDFVDIKTADDYQNLLTSRYEDKFTSPQSGEEQSFSTVSITSLDLESECPSHGRRTNPYLATQNRSNTGFAPNATYVSAYATINNLESPQIIKSEHRSSRKTFPVKSRRSFLKGKNRKIFSLKQRR